MRGAKIVAVVAFVAVALLTSVRPAVVAGLGLQEERAVPLHNAERGDLVELEGTVVLLGSEPRPYLALRVSRDLAEPAGTPAAGRENAQPPTVRFADPPDGMLRLQGRDVRVRGRVELLAAGRGFPTAIAIDEYELLR